MWSRQATIVFRFKLSGAPGWRAFTYPGWRNLWLATYESTLCISGRTTHVPHLCDVGRWVNKNKWNSSCHENLWSWGLIPWAQKSYSDLGEKPSQQYPCQDVKQNLLFHLTYCRLEFQQIWLMGKNPAPVDMVNIPLFSGFYTSQVVQDFCSINSMNGSWLGGGFKYFLFSPLFGEDSHFDEHIFQMGWFNHQLDDGLSLSWCFPNFATFPSRSFFPVHQLMITPQFIQIFWGAFVFIQKNSRYQYFPNCMGHYTLYSHIV